MIGGIYASCQRPVGIPNKSQRIQSASWLAIAIVSSSEHADRRRKAISRRRSVLIRARQNSVFDSGAPLMKQSAEKYLQYLSSVRNSSPHTILNYGKDLSQFLEYLSPPGAQPPALNEITHTIIREFVAHLHDQGLEKSSIARKLAALRSFFKYCVREGLLAENPARLVPTPKLPKRIPSVLSAEEMNGFLNRAGGDGAYGAGCMVEMLASDALIRAAIPQIVADAPKRSGRKSERMLPAARSRIARTSLRGGTARQRTHRFESHRHRSERARVARSRQRQ